MIRSVRRSRRGRSRAQPAPSAMVGLLVALTVLGGCAAPSPGTNPSQPVTPDPALTVTVAQVPQVALRGPDNPTLDPAVLNAFWDSATVRSATPLGDRPNTPPGPGDGAAGASTRPADPARPFAQALLVRTPIGPGTAPAQSSGAGAAAPLPQVSASPPLSVGPTAALAVHATGRLFFTLAGQPRSCTASVVTGASGSVIATAGHCLLADATPGKGPRAEAGNFLFAPGFHDGVFPDGRWLISSVHIAAGWRERGDWTEDVAFLRLTTNSARQSVQSTVGALGVVFSDHALSAAVALLGYPAVAPFDGTSLRWCATPAQPGGDPVDPGAIAVPCTMTAGYSGGPVLAGYDTAHPSGYLAGVASHDYGAGTVYGAHFGQAALDAYLEADRL